MKSSVNLANHPLHPILVPIPIGAFLLTLIGDIAYTATSNTFWYSFSSWTMGIGIVGALLAAIPGFLDYISVVPEGEPKRQATVHMAVNLGIVAIFALNLVMRLFTTASTGANWWLSLIMTVVGVGALMYTGWLGGELVYRHRMGIDERVHPEAPSLRVTMSREEAERVHRRR